MTLAPFAPGAFTNRRSADHFVQMRNQGSDLERQLSTGRRADSYAGLGVKRGPALDMRAKLNGLESFQGNIKGRQSAHVDADAERGRARQGIGPHPLDAHDAEFECLRWRRAAGADHCAGRSQSSP